MILDKCRVVSVINIVIMLVFIMYFFFFKQKTAYEMRISDWSSDVCSSDLSTSATPTVAVCELFPGLPPCERIIAHARESTLCQAGSRMEIGRASCRERVCKYV